MSAIETGETYTCTNCGKQFDSYRVDDCPRCGANLSNMGRWR